MIRRLETHKPTFTLERLDFRLEFGKAFGFPDGSIQFALFHGTGGSFKGLHNFFETAVCGVLVMLDSKGGNHNRSALLIERCKSDIDLGQRSSGRPQ
jgi:hypothetical protein